MYKKHDVGKTGEKLAAKYLEQSNYKIIKQNFRCKQGEIDIIAIDNKELEQDLVFVEVKLRKNGDFARAREYVDRRKQDRIRITASAYLAQNPTALQPRFDVIEIYAPEGPASLRPEITHLEDAFQ